MVTIAIQKRKKKGMDSGKLRVRNNKIFICIRKNKDTLQSISTSASTKPFRKKFSFSSISGKLFIMDFNNLESIRSCSDRRPAIIAYINRFTTLLLSSFCKLHIQVIYIYIYLPESFQIHPRSKGILLLDIVLHGYEK